MSYRFKGPKVNASSGIALTEVSGLTHLSKLGQMPTYQAMIQSLRL